LAKNPGIRKRWGCDGPTEEPCHGARGCPVCDGSDPECPDCHGTNEIHWHECPWKLIEPVHERAIVAALHVEKGVLPSAGGWHDQAATFVQAWPTIAREIAHWREWHAEQERKRLEQLRPKR